MILSFFLKKVLFSLIENISQLCIITTVYLLSEANITSVSKISYMMLIWSNARHFVLIVTVYLPHKCQIHIQQWGHGSRTIIMFSELIIGAGGTGVAMFSCRSS
jgi:hypothetical protein